jgi:hypothetical protein
MELMFCNRQELLFVRMGRAVVSVSSYKTNELI